MSTRCGALHPHLFVSCDRSPHSSLSKHEGTSPDGKRIVWRFVAAVFALGGATAYALGWLG